MIIKGKEFFSFNGNGPAELCYRQVATCPHTGETASFATRQAAVWWLELIADTVTSEARRKSHP